MIGQNARHTGVSISGPDATANVLIGDDVDSNNVGVVLDAAGNIVEEPTIHGNATAGVSISGRARPRRTP